MEGREIERDESPGRHNRQRARDDRAADDSAKHSRETAVLSWSLFKEKTETQRRSGSGKGPQLPETEQGFQM